MSTIPEIDIVSFLKNNIQPLADESFGHGYRASATLKDGLHLPCVIFRNASTRLDLAIRRFKEEQSPKGLFSKSFRIGYRETVKSFVVAGNRINHHDIDKVEKSRYAFPVEILKQIRGETSMGWTAFVAKFKDGRNLSFGTGWNTEFFELPDDFKVEDIVEIINNSYLLKTGEILGHRSSLDRVTRKNEMEKIYGDKPFFECYVDNL